MFKPITLLFTILLLASLVFANDSGNVNFHKEGIKIESLPEGIPNTLSIPIEYSGENFTIELEKNYVFGIHS